MNKPTICGRNMYVWKTVKCRVKARPIARRPIAGYDPTMGLQYAADTIDLVSISVRTFPNLPLFCLGSTIQSEHPEAVALWPLSYLNEYQWWISKAMHVNVTLLIWLVADASPSKIGHLFGEFGPDFFGWLRKPPILRSWKKHDHFSPMTIGGSSGLQEVDEICCFVFFH